MNEWQKEVLTNPFLSGQTLELDFDINEAQSDPVNHPSHYTSGKIEVIDYIEDQKLPYHLGNVVKYISRAGKKDKGKTIEDLKKAQWYLNRYIQLVESQSKGEDTDGDSTVYHYTLEAKKAPDGYCYGNQKDV